MNNTPHGTGMTYKYCPRKQHAYRDQNNYYIHTASTKAQQYTFSYATGTLDIKARAYIYTDIHNTNIHVRSYKRNNWE